MPGFDIASPSNERIKRLIRLRDRGQRDLEGVFLVEGARLVDRALAAGLTPYEVYLDGAVAYSGPGEVVTVDPYALSRASYRNRSQGIIAVLPHLPTMLTSITVGSAGLVLMAEAIEKPGNLGAMLRTADAVGAHGLVAVGQGVDPFNPNVVRASLGALFTVPIAVASLQSVADWTAANGLRVVAASPEASSLHWDVDLTGSVAILIGSEALGLTEEARELGDTTVSIPMRGAGDSLNASVSLALLAYEALRQRR